MTAAQCMEKMIAFSGGNIHDIDHFIRVWTYAAPIGRLEGLDPEDSLPLRSRPSFTTLPARCAGRSMAAPTARIRRRRGRG